VKDILLPVDFPPPFERNRARLIERADKLSVDMRTTQGQHGFVEQSRSKVGTRV